MYEKIPDKEFSFTVKVPSNFTSYAEVIDYLRENFFKDEVRLNVANLGEDESDDCWNRGTVARVFARL